MAEPFVACMTWPKKNLIGFFMGQVMQATNGSAKPELARELLQKQLNND